MEAECPKCGKFDFEYDNSVNFTLIICPNCDDELGAVYKQGSLEGIEYCERKVKRGKQNNL